MHRNLAAALTLVALILPLPVRAQEVSGGSALDPIPFPSALGTAVSEQVLARSSPSSHDAAGMPTSSSALFALGVNERGGIRSSAAPSLARHLRLGAGIGALAGAAFGLWVISIADCGGPNCTTERVVGVAGNALGGAAIGAILAGALYLIRR